MSHSPRPHARGHAADALRHALLALGLLLLAGCVTPGTREAPPAEPAPAPPAAGEPPVEPAEPAEAPEPPPPPPEPTLGAVLDRFRGGLASPACIVGPANRAWRQRYAGWPPRFAERIDAILPLFDYVLREVHARALPSEYALVPIVEGWYQPAIAGRGGPMGMWQMIPSTARAHGVTIIPGYDGRLSPVDATAGALHHLEAMQARFGEWRAAAMAYNAGEYRLARVLPEDGLPRASGERRMPRGMPRESYEYIAKMRALACLLAEPGRAGIPFDRERRFEPLQVLQLPPGAGSLADVAGAIGVPADALRALNPSFRNGQVVAAAPRGLLVPEGALARVDDATALFGPAGGAREAAAASAEAAAIAGEDAPARHVVRAGDSLWTIARRYRVPLASLRAWNGLGERAVIRPGQVLKLAP
jgi:membrane-bound lytic murein transglycosylase D